MKKHAMVIMLIFSLGSLCWGTAQGTRNDLFDVKKSRQELEIMRGILSTTIGFVSNEEHGHDTGGLLYSSGYMRGFGMGSHITAYYLYGQGATFIIPISSLRYATTLKAWSVAPKIASVYTKDMTSSMRELEQEMSLLNMEMDSRNEEMAVAAREAAEAAQSLAQEVADQAPFAASSGDASGGVVGGVPGGVVGGVPGGVSGGVAGGVPGGVGKGSGKGKGASTPQAAPAAPTPPPQPPPPAKQMRNAEEMRKRLEDAQAKVRQAREDNEARRKKMLESLTEITGYLVEALANHGDSLTFIKPNEYINIVITTDDGMPLFGDGEGSSTREVLSVQKSVITDYKAGRLTLDAFKQKVLQYNN